MPCLSLLLLSDLILVRFFGIMLINRGISVDVHLVSTVLATDKICCHVEYEQLVIVLSVTCLRYFVTERPDKFATPNDHNFVLHACVHAWCVSVWCVCVWGLYVLPCYVMTYSALLCSSVLRAV